jgi:hypothetical protein
MIKPNKGSIVDINTYRIWLVNFNQSTQGKFIVFGSNEDAKEAARTLLKGPMKGYPYKAQIKEVTEKVR